MFQLETEDMLPRMAPKPNAAVPLGATEAIVRPQVPEVSILFGQQEVNIQQQKLPLTNNTKPTYEAWKKQMLPKVSFPSTIASCSETLLNENISVQDHNAPRSNVYPFRSVVNSGALTMTTAVQSIGGGVRIANNPIMYRRSSESCNEHINYQQIQELPSLPQVYMPPPNSRDILTICAGTQTDKILDSVNLNNVPLSEVATKKDVEDICLMLEEMKKEQQRILKILETLIHNPAIQTGTKPQTCDVAVQIESIEENDYQSFPNDIASLQQNKDGLQAAPKNKFIQHLKPSGNISQTPKGKPVAQSTTYRPDSPQTQRLQHNIQDVPAVPTHQHAGNKPSTIVPKSASDTSLAMNELALKYLPNEKLAELLKELNMDCPLGTCSTIPNDPITPVKLCEDNCEKGPSDISNASYKYLKKYRLLSEDHDDSENENHMPSYSSPQYNVRNTPANQRQTPTNKNSPYSGRLPLSPLARASPPLSTIPQQIVNLENIKHQPKFL